MTGPPFRARALLFDMDGLLVDSEPLWGEVEADFARERGGNFTAEHAAACVGRGLASTLRFMHDTFGFSVNVARDSDDIVGRFVDRVGSLRLKPGALDLLDAARDLVPCALGSSSARRIVSAVLGATGVADRFRVVVTGDDVARTKPAPDIFLACASRLGVDVRDAVVLEDSPAGAESGRAAGATVIAVPEHAGTMYGGSADVVVTDLFEARRLLHLVR